MKKMAILAAMVAIFVFAFNLVWANKVTITEENIHLLKGNWEGYRRGMGQTGRILELESRLEIFNDEPPFKGELIHYNVRGGGDQIIPFDNGVIEKGELFVKWKWDGYWIRLGFYSKKGKKMELRGKDIHQWDLKFFKK